MTTDSTYAQSAISIVTDWTYGILPVFIVWDLQMSKQKRITLALVLGLGAIASVATIVRVPYLVTLTQTDDFLFATVDVAIWSTVEPGVGISVVCLATLRPLFRSCLNRAGLKSDSRSRSRGYARRSGYQKPSPYAMGSENSGIGRSVSDNKNCTCGARKGFCTCRPTYAEDSRLRNADLERGGMSMGTLPPRAYASPKGRPPPDDGRYAIFQTTSLSTIEEPYDILRTPSAGRMPTREGLPIMEDIERPHTARTRNDSIRNDAAQQTRYHAF